MKIVYVLENYLPHIGGVEVLFKHICEAAAKNHDVTVVTHRLPGTRKNDVINGVKIVRITVPSFGSRYFFTFLSLRELFRICKDADVIHTTTYNGAPPAWIAGKWLKIPTVITIHEVIGRNWSRLLQMNWFSGKIHEYLEKMVVSLSFNRAVCVSNSTKKDFESVTKKKAVVIHNGVDYEFWDPAKYDGNVIRKKLGLEGKFIVLFYGRPGVSKGFEFLLKAVPAIIEEIPEAELVAILSKDKTYKARYDNMIKLIDELDIKDNVVVHDPVPYKELPQYIKAADCVVVPSLTEGFGFTVAESCAMGKPVVASETTSIPEVISGDFIMVKPAKSSAIAEGVVNVFNMKVKRTKLKKFTWEKCIEQYEKLYNEVKNEKSS